MSTARYVASRARLRAARPLLASSLTILALVVGPGPHAALAADSPTPGAPAAATAATPPPAEAFGTVPRMREVALSPGGSRIAWAEIVGNDERVIAMDLATQAVRKTIPITEPMKLRDVTWADDDTLLVELSTTHQVDVHARYEFSRVLAVPMAQSRAMAQALAAAGKPGTLVSLPGEDHWLSRSTTRVRVLQETERLLATHLR